jgi:hypothetical protein
MDQVVVDPSQARDEELLARVDELAEATRPNYSAATLLWLKVTRVAHLFGLHTYVPMKVYDRPSDRLIQTVMRVCLYCARAIR